MSFVKARPDEDIESLLRRFKKSVERSGLLADVKRCAHFEKPSDKRRRARDAAVKKEIKRQQKARPKSRNINFKWNYSRTERIQTAAPVKSEYRGNNSGGYKGRNSNYKGGYKGNSNYQGNQTAGSGGYQGNRSGSGTGYQGNRSSGNSTGGYQGNRQNTGGYNRSSGSTTGGNRSDSRQNKNQGFSNRPVLIESKDSKLNSNKGK